MFRPVFAPQQRIGDPLFWPDLDITMMVRENCAVRADHVKDPFTGLLPVSWTSSQGAPPETGEHECKGEYSAGSISLKQ